MFFYFIMDEYLVFFSQHDDSRNNKIGFTDCQANRSGSNRY